MRASRPLRWAWLVAGCLPLWACGNHGDSKATKDPSPAASAAANDPFAVPPPAADGPKLVATSLATVVYDRPGTVGEKIGYLRVGGVVARAKEPFTKEGCPGGWYPIRPAGFVCVGDDASLDLQHPVARALGKLPDLSKPLPYQYGFIRWVAPQYLRIPTKAEQNQYEFELPRHLRAYARYKDEWNQREVGSNDVPLDASGVAIGPAPAKPPVESENILFGGSGNDQIPWWLDGGRKIPHLSGYKAPGYAVIAGRVRRHTGLALIDSFVPDEDAGARRMVVTTDGRMVPASKLKPNVGSTWHGVPLAPRSGFRLPVAFVTERKGAQTYQLTDTSTVDGVRLPWRATLDLTGESRVRQGVKYVEIRGGTWAKAEDLAVAAKPSSLPSYARGNQKWIDLSIVSQTIVAYEGETPVYVTMVSTGRDGLGDPQTTRSTVRGTFRIREKHVTTTMDANDVDNQFELRDVPWVEYFHHGYALHAAYWHDDYGKPRSHGCVNMSPIDAHWFFFWTTPALPEGWHGVYANKKTDEGTIVFIHA